MIYLFLTMLSSVPGTSLGLIFLLAAVDESCKKGNKQINGKRFNNEQGTYQHWLTELIFSLCNFMPPLTWSPLQQSFGMSRNAFLKGGALRDIPKDGCERD